MTGTGPELGGGGAGASATGAGASDCGRQDDICVSEGDFGGCCGSRMVGACWSLGFGFPCFFAETVIRLPTVKPNALWDSPSCIAVSLAFPLLTTVTGVAVSSAGTGWASSRDGNGSSSSTETMLACHVVILSLIISAFLVGD